MGGHALGEFATRLATADDMADNWTLQTETFNVQKSASGVRITVRPAQNALTLDLAPIAPRR
jgi:hypothetical protein